MDYYFDNRLPIEYLINNKFKLNQENIVIPSIKTKSNTKTIIKKNTKKKYQYHKQFRKYQLIRLTLFLNKIFNYEPELIRIIGFIHDNNYESIVPIPNNNILNERRPIRRNACIGFIEPIIETQDFYCICSSCDPYGYYMLQPYRIGDKLQDKLYKYFNCQHK